MPQADSQYKNSLQPKGKQKTKNPRKGEKSDFQSNYIIRLKYSVFNNNKSHKAYQETEKYSTFKSRKKKKNKINCL